MPARLVVIFLVMFSYQTDVFSYDASKIKPTTAVPFQNEGYVVQGVASSCEGGQDSVCNDERLYISMYWSGSDNNTPKNRSLVAEIEGGGNFNLTRCFKLGGNSTIDQSFGHVGGIAYYNNNLYISSNGSIAKYDIENEPNTNPEVSADCNTIVPEISWKTKASSFVSYAVINNMPSLLVGRACLESGYPDCQYFDGSAAKPYAYQYALDPVSGNLNGGDNADLIEDWVNKYRLPYAAQGVDIYHANSNQDLLLVSVSRVSTRYSKILAYNLSDTLCPRQQSCVEPSSVSSFTPPEAVQDLALSNGKLWSATESTSLQWRDNLRDYYPYIFYALPIDSGWDSILGPNSPRKSNFVKIEDSFFHGYGGWHNNTDRIWEGDINGDGRDDIIIGPYSTNGCWYILEGLSNGSFADRGCVVQAYSGWHNNADRIRIMDVNADGADDIVIGPYSLNGCWYVLSGQQGVADLVDLGCQVTYKKNWYKYSDRIRPMDVNGDGADDIVIGPSSAGNWYVLEGIPHSYPADFRPGHIMSSISPSFGTWYNQTDRIRVSDVNGDNREDIVIGPDSLNGCWHILSGQPGVADFTSNNCVIQAYKEWANHSDRIRLVDVNGDNKDDVLIGPNSSSGNWYVLKSKGLNFDNAGIWAKQFKGWYDNTDRIFIMDGNGNGKGDVLVGPQKSFGTWDLMYSDTNKFDTPRQWAIDSFESWHNNANRIRIMDINGDSKDDIVIGPESNGDWHILLTD